MRFTLQQFAIQFISILISTILTLQFNSSNHIVSSLRINKLEVPSAVSNGSSVVLYCDYDLEGLGLYSVKWYKNYVEFFRYIPSEDDKVATFKLDGAYVDIDKSNATHVALVRTDLSSEGSYACEVSTDQMYTTIRAERQMKIYVLSDEKISIEGKELEYDINHDINLTCISGPTKPAARLVWYINDRRALAHELDYLPVYNTSNGLFITRLGLVFHAYPRFFVRGLLRLQCTAGVILTFQFEASEYPLGDSSRSKSHKQLHGAEVKVEKETPIITKKDNHKYRVGDTLYLNCTSQSKVAHLMWFINEDKANSSQLIFFTAGRKAGSPPIVGLVLNIEQQHFQLPEFKVRCVATIHERIVDYYSEEIQIRTENHEFAEAKSSYDPTFANYAKKVTESGLILWSQIVVTIIFILFHTSSYYVYLNS